MIPPNLVRSGTLSILALVFAGSVNAQISVPLTDSRLTFTGNGHYNSSMCGGAIYLPELNDGVSFGFSGSDFQLEFIIQDSSDARNITVSPDNVGFSAVGLNHLGEVDQSLDCSNRIVERGSDPGSFRGQLFLGDHTVTVKNGGASGWDGTGVILTAVTYWPDALSGVSTVTSDHGAHASAGQKKTIFGGVVGGVIGVWALVLPAISIL